MPRQRISGNPALFPAFDNSHKDRWCDDKENISQKKTNDRTCNSFTIEGMEHLHQQHATSLNNKPDCKKKLRVTCK